MNENLFSHAVESEFVRPTYEGSTDPVENPLFSDQQK